MKRLLSLGLILGIPAGAVLPIAYIFTQEKNILDFVTIMVQSLMIVVGLFLYLNYRLKHEYQRVFVFRPMFKDGLALSTLLALIMSLGSMSFYAVNGGELDQLFVEQSVTAMQQAGESQEAIDAFLKKIEETPQQSLFVRSAGRIVFGMVLGVFYTVVICALLKFAPGTIREPQGSSGKS